MSFLRTDISLVIVGALFWTLIGCGGSEDGEPTAPVSGTVTYKGDPLPTGTVTFIPDGGGPPARGQIQQDGTYQLTTYKEGDGAVLGSHKVMITAFEPPDPGDVAEDAEGKGETWLIPEKYGRSGESSGLTANVQEGENTAVDFELTDD